jgi:hypothetical protein
MVFECPEIVKRAIRARAGIDGGSPADVIVAALEAYLSEEIEKAARRVHAEDAHGPKLVESPVRPVGHGLERP